MSIYAGIDNQFIQQVATQPGLTWQQRIKAITDQYQIRANEAAKLLAPYYTSQREEFIATLNLPPKVRSLTYLDQQFLQQTAAEPGLTEDEKVQRIAFQYTIDTNEAYQLLLPYLQSLTYQLPSESQYDDNFLRSVATQPGLSWQQRVKQVTDKYGVRANVAARLLSPYYLSLAEQPTYIPSGSITPTYSPVLATQKPLISSTESRTYEQEQFIQQIATQPGLTWQERIKALTAKYFISASEATKLMSPYYESRREQRSPFYSPVQSPSYYAAHSPGSPGFSGSFESSNPNNIYVDPNFMQNIARNKRLTWPGKVKSVSKKYGINAGKAASLLSPYYQSIKK